MDDCEQLCLWEPYEPQVNDYVIWDRGEYGEEEGWIYFRDESYITMSLHSKPRSDEYVNSNGCRNDMIHTLLVCPNEYWHQLKYVKSRDHTEPQHY